MASHLNAHNMPGPGVSVGSSATTPRRRWLWVAIGILAFIVLDRASLFFIPPQYRGVPDLEQYHTLYYSLKFQQFNRMKNQLETRIPLRPSPPADNSLGNLPAYF